METESEGVGRKKEKEDEMREKLPTRSSPIPPMTTAYPFSTSTSTNPCVLFGERETLSEALTVGADAL